MKRNPRDIPWTVLYRRKYKKGIHADAQTQKKRVKRSAPATARPIAGITVETLMATRNQKPEFRKAQRDQAVKAAKDAARAKKDARKVAAAGEKAAKAAQQKAQKAGKPVKAAAPRVGGKR